MSSREEFLQRVRQSLRYPTREHGGDLPATPIPPPPALKDWQREAELVRQRCAANREALLLKLEEMAAKMSWHVVRAGNPDGAARAVADLAAKLGATSVVVTQHPVFGRVAVDSTLRQRGIRVVPTVTGIEGAPSSREELRQATWQAGLGVTGVDYMIAETATAVMLPRRGVSRLASLAPPVHVAVVEPEQVVETLDDFLALRKAESLSGADPRGYLNLISGPSRTGDIEQTIVVGAHGPREVHLIAVW
ncbi:MAG: LUD domain-containing protein [Chloroflexi bacterium]|nr:LUD domain-containing protein [Chloroflexota bacterium]